MVLNRAEAAQRSLETTHNVVGTCQLVTRGWFEAPSAGDQDGDGDADAVDGWLSEPVRFRHPGDRNPPRGVPIAFSGGSHGFGHRAMSLGKPGVRSTDMLNNRWSPGDTSTTSIAQIEASMGVNYLGWSETIDGILIPRLANDKPDPKPHPRPPLNSRGIRIDMAIHRLRKAGGKKGTRRYRLVERAVKVLQRIRPSRRRTRKG